MFTPHVTAVGYLPTAHPVAGPRLTIRGHDEVLRRRLERAAKRVGNNQTSTIGTDARVPKRAAVAV
jgi:hypothetical protein